MNKVFLFLFITLFIQSAFAGLLTNDISNACGTYEFHNNSRIRAVFTINEYTCNFGYFLPANTPGCQPCPTGYTCNGGTFTFNPNQSHGLSINEYTCNFGYFLPANTPGCQLCPTGYTCDGGTFTFNPNQSQGLRKNTGQITQNISNVCAYNFDKNLNAVFTPNTININWYDRDNIVAQTTCTYGEKITLPPPPTRPGYIFSGWRLRTNN